jgi:hypothetical protein
MYKEIVEYIKPTLTGLKEIDAGFDVDLLPANQMDNYYFIKIDSIEDEEAESYSIDTVSVEIELWFLLANKKDNYSVSVDKANTIKKAVKELTSDNTNETTLQIINTQNVKIQGLNNIIKNNWLKCTVNFDIRIFDGQ